MTTPNREQIYRWQKATLENLPDHKEFIFVLVDGQHKTIMKPNVIADSIEKYPNSEYFIQEELPQSIPLTKEVKETIEDVLKRNGVNLESLRKMVIPDGVKHSLGARIHTSMQEYANQFSTSLPVNEEEKKDWTNDFILSLDSHIDEDTMVKYGERASIIDFIKKYMHKKQFKVTGK